MNLPPIKATEEVTGSDICDSSWGACRCQNKAEFLIKQLNSPGCWIMCGEHKKAFEIIYRGAPVEFYRMDFGIESKIFRKELLTTMFRIHNLKINPKRPDEFFFRIAKAMREKEQKIRRQMKKGKTEH